MKRQRNKRYLQISTCFTLLAGVFACSGYTVLQKNEPAPVTNSQSTNIANNFPLTLPIVRAEYQTSIYGQKTRYGGSRAGKKRPLVLDHHIYNVYLMVEIQDGLEDWQQAFGVICELPDGSIESYILNASEDVLRSGQLHEIPCSITTKKKGYVRFTLAAIDSVSGDFIVYDENEPFISKEVRLY